MIDTESRRLALRILVQELAPLEDNILDVTWHKMSPFHQLRHCYRFPADREEAQHGALKGSEAFGVGVLHLAPVAPVVALEPARQPADAADRLTAEPAGPDLGHDLPDVHELALA